MIGPYQILGPLGRGSIGTVSRARHTQTGETVALKTLDEAWEAHLPTLRREIQALARIRHPGVVRILDSGTEQGLPWLAMELVEGLDLRAWSLQSKTAEPDCAAPAALLAVFARLCQTLAYLHGQGLLHRDLKPENILVRPDQTPVLVDFGLASFFAGSAGREKLQVDAEMTGALYTMAPELIRGELPDARADLYAVGCMLLEALAGQPPFFGATPRQILQAHLNHVAPLPSGLPQPLQGVLHGLLAKEPRQRLGYAVDAVPALLASTASPLSLPPVPAPRPYLYQSRLAGRDHLLDALTTRVARLQAGQSALVLLGGESGAGKTRLVVEAARQAEREGVRVLCGECSGPAQGATAPLQALRGPLQAIADRCRERGRRETERLLGRNARLLALYEPALLDLAGPKDPEPVPLAPEAARLRLYSALCDTLAAVARSEPLLLVLDDLQWADGLTLGWLGFLAQSRRWAKERILLLGTCRTEEAGPELFALLQDPAVAQLRLERLDEAATRAVIADMLAADRPPEALVRLLAQQCEGNPFFIGEYLRSAVEERLLQRDPQGRWQATGAGFEALPSPRSLLDLVARRLAALEPEALALAQAASVLGRETSEDLLSAVAGQPQARLWEVLEELRRRHVLEESLPGRFRFAHDKLREAAYDGIEAARRGQLHRRAAQALQDAPATRPDRLGLLGHHWEHCGELALARRDYLAGARQAAAAYAQSEAGRLFQAYLRLVGTPDRESVEARLELAEQVLTPGGEGDRGWSELERVLDESELLGLPALKARAWLDQSILCREQGRMDEAQRLAEQALAVQRELGSKQGEGSVLNEMGVIASQQSRFEEADRLLTEALALHRETGDVGQEGASLSNLAGIAWHGGRLAEARLYCEQALIALRKAGDRGLEVGTMGNLVQIHRAEGDLPGARRLIEEVIVLARSIGQWTSEASDLNTLASILWEQEESFEAVQSVFQEALARQRALGLHRSSGGPLLNLAELARLAGRLTEAQDWLEQALSVHRQVGDRMLEGLAESKLGLLHLEAGRSAQARAACQHALELLEQVQGHLNVPQAALALAVVERRTGDLARAEALLTQAEAGFRQLRRPMQQQACACEKGHLALARGDRAGAFVEMARELAALANPKRLALDRLARLERAVDASTKGQPLLQGEAPEDWPPALAPPHENPSNPATSASS